MWPTIHPENPIRAHYYFNTQVCVRLVRDFIALFGNNGQTVSQVLSREPLKVRPERDCAKSSN